MKFAVSNIGWPQTLDTQVYELLVELGYDGIEIAPTRCFKLGYDATIKEKQDFKTILEHYNLKILSMQSLLFGVTSPIFSSKENRLNVELKLSKSVDFANEFNIPNLVFGSPGLRNVNTNEELEEAVLFFKHVSTDSSKKDVVFSIEPNPIIYNTNFLNRTQDALEFVKKHSNRGLGINLDLGTVIFNQENINELLTNETIIIIQHVHISEPNLVPIQESRHLLHKELLSKLKHLDYQKTVSIEMKAIDDIFEIERILRYIRSVAIEAEVWHGN